MRCTCVELRYEEKIGVADRKLLRTDHQIAFHVVVCPVLEEGRIEPMQYRTFIRQILFTDEKSDIIELVNPSLTINYHSVQHIKHSISYLVWKDLGRMYKDIMVRVPTLVECFASCQEIFGSVNCRHELNCKVFKCSISDYIREYGVDSYEHVVAMPAASRRSPAHERLTEKLTESPHRPDLHSPAKSGGQAMTPSPQSTKTTKTTKFAGTTSIGTYLSTPVGSKRAASHTPYQLYKMQSSAQPARAVQPCFETPPEIFRVVRGRPRSNTFRNYDAVHWLPHAEAGCGFHIAPAGMEMHENSLEYLHKDVSASSDTPKPNPPSHPSPPKPPSPPPIPSTPSIPAPPTLPSIPDPLNLLDSFNIPYNDTPTIADPDKHAPTNDHLEPFPDFSNFSNLGGVACMHFGQGRRCVAWDPDSQFSAAFLDEEGFPPL